MVARRGERRAGCKWPALLIPSSPVSDSEVPGKVNTLTCGVTANSATERARSFTHMYPVD